MSYRIAGIDVHKKMLAVVVSDVEVDGEYQMGDRSKPARRQILISFGRFAGEGATSVS
jgi:hypothetical protein